MRGDLPYSGRKSRVSYEAFRQRSAICGNDIALSQNALLVRDPVHQLFIDARANRSREGWLAIAFERRITSVFLQHFLSSRVEVGR